MVYTIVYKKNKYDRRYRPIEYSKFETSNLVDIVKLAQAFRENGDK